MLSENNSFCFQLVKHLFCKRFETLKVFILLQITLLLFLNLNVSNCLTQFSCFRCKASVLICICNSTKEWSNAYRYCSAFNSEETSVLENIFLDFFMEGGGMRSTEEERSSLKHKNVSSISAMHTSQMHNLKCTL